VPLVEDDEVSVDAGVFGDQLKEGHLHSAQDHMVMQFHELVFVILSWHGLLFFSVFRDLRALEERLSQVVGLVSLTFDVVSDLKNSLFGLEIVIDLAVHLNVEVEPFVKHRSKGVVDQASTFTAA
jgi:hypothetical protein